MSEAIRPSSYGANAESEAEILIKTYLDKTLIFISDLHIGGEALLEDFYSEKEFIKFLDHLSLKEKNCELIILGDFFDLWKIADTKHKNKIKFIISQRKEMFKRLKEFGKKHQITVIGGNHDHELVYEKKYRDLLETYNIHVDPNQYIKREFKRGKKVHRILAEHGNQVEPGSAFTDFKLPTDSSMAYHIDKLFVYEFMKKGHEQNAPKWVANADNVLIELIPYWLISKYFYHEIGPIFKAIIIPMLVLFGFALPYMIFDIATEFYRPKVLEPLLLMLDTNQVFKFIGFLLYFDLVIVTVLFFISLIKKDLNKRLRNYYGIQSLSEVLISRARAYAQHSLKVLKGENPFKEPGSIYIHGHTHAASMHVNKKSKTVTIDTGSWKQLMKKSSARFNFPNVFVPYYSLSYLKIKPSSSGIQIQLRERPKKFKQELTLLERFALKRNKHVPFPKTRDSVIDTYVLEF